MAKAIRQHPFSDDSRYRRTCTRPISPCRTLFSCISPITEREFRIHMYICIYPATAIYELEGCAREWISIWGNFVSRRTLFFYLASPPMHKKEVHFFFISRIKIAGVCLKPQSSTSPRARVLFTLGSLSARARCMYTCNRRRRHIPRVLKSW